MPQFITEIPNCEETVSSTIVVSVLTRIIRTYKWYEEFDFNYSLLGDTTLVSGSEIDLPTRDRSQQRLATDQKVMVEVTERYNEEAIRATHIRQKTQKNIFECDRTKTTLHPGYQQMIMDISMRFRFRSRHSAENFRKKVRLAGTKSVDGMKLEVKYNYTIPYAYLDILKRIYDLMENRHGYGLTIGEWLRECFVSNVTTLANRSGDKSVLAIAELNQNVIVLVNNPDEISDKDKESDEDAWVVEMQFEVHYDRPDVVRMRFQHLINNQFIGMDIASRFKVLKQDYLKAKTHMSQLDALRSGAIPIGKNPLSGATSPIFDDWMPPCVSMDYPSVIRAMITLDEDDLTSIIDLNDIVDYELTPTTLNWLTNTHSTVTEFGKNIFWVRLWSWDKFSGYNTYELDQQLHLISDEELDPRINYHVTIGISVSPEYLDDSVWDELANDRPMLDEWLTIVAPNVKDFINDTLVEYDTNFRDTDEVPWFTDPDTEYDPTAVTVLPPYVINKVKDILTKPGDGCYNTKYPLRYNETSMKTVMIYGIIARRKGVNYA